jgi:zinc protease
VAGQIFRFIFLVCMIAPMARAENTSQITAQSQNKFDEQISFKVEKFKMPNGLTVLLYEDHSTPIISYQTWFRVGSKNEQMGFTGIAHLFEHMMFKGAKRYSGDQFESVLQSNGASNNAFTSHDYTGYYENLPSSKLELVMDVESDRMENLQITDDFLKSEREVVKEERRMRVDNSPTGVLQEVLFGVAFQRHPYHWPVIGYMADLDHIDLAKAKDFNRTYYAPNNAVIVIAGDFNPSTAKTLLNKFYGNLKAQTIPVLQTTPESEQKVARIQAVEKAVQNVTVAIGYVVPKAGSPESYALDLLANIMGHGTSSRLYKRLVYKDQVATSVNVSNYTLQQAGVFETYVSLKPNLDFHKASQAVLAEIWRPRNLVVSPVELEVAKKQVMKSYVDGLKTVFGKAEALAMNEILFDDYNQLFTDLQKYQAVTAQDIKAAANKYLIPQRSTIAIVKPLSKAARKSTVKVEAQKKGV